jgi:signal transduction histidine kinase/ActR/RegA family two-component response regulator
VIDALYILAVALQGLAVAYGVLLLERRRGAAGAWLFLLGAMIGMLVWRVVMLTEIEPPAYFNPSIAIWGSTCMVVAMFLFGREVVRRELAETQRKQAETERDALLASERAARGEAERASRLKDDFLATLSHELRTPLAAILGWCTLLRLKRDDRAEIDRAIETIERNAQAQTRLVDDLLDVNRMQAGALYLDFAPVRLDVPVRAALDGIRPAADAKSLSIELCCGSDPPVVAGDAGRLRQIAANLLMNAVKFTPAGGTIKVSVEMASDHAKLVVFDDGEGIDGAVLPHLFARFRQGDSGTTRRHGGLGLGLSIVASLARLHGGDVRAESEGLGKGSTFTVALPLAPDQSVTEVGTSTGARTVTVATLSGLRILIVDDEPDVRAVVSRLVEQMGARVVALESGQGIESALAGFQPHILLIDIGMPLEDGYTLIRRIRTLPAAAGGGTPAISLTAHARNEDRARAIASGFQDHLPKPIDLPLLVFTVRKLAGRAVVAENA